MAERVTPLTQQDVAREMVRAQSYQEAKAELERRGLEVDLKTMIRWTESVGKHELMRRDQELAGAMKLPVNETGELAGKRVGVGLDGGRSRLREPNRARRRRKSGRRGFKAAWREPKGFVIYIMDENGALDRSQPVWYKMTMGDADAVAELLAGYLRVLGAAHAKEVEFVADGADWIWNRVGTIANVAEIPKERVVELVDFYHACEHLSEAVGLLNNTSKQDKERLYRRLKRDLSQSRVDTVIATLSEYLSGTPKEPLKTVIQYFIERKERMDYKGARRRKLAIGSGAMESAIRRVVNLRYKGPGILWRRETLEVLLHLRALMKAGRWEQTFEQLLIWKQPPCITQSVREVAAFG